MSKEMEPFKVVNYALILNKYLWTQPNASRIILYYAVGRESKNIDICDNDAFTQVVYFYYNNRDLLPDIIREEIEDMADFPDNSDDYRGYNPKGEFDPKEEVGFLLKYSDSHREFGNNCRDWYKFYISFSGDAKFHLDFDDDKFSLYLEFRRYYPVSNGIPTSLPLLMLLEWQDKNSIHNVALIAMYSAIRSIIGRKEVAATTRAFIHARMFGARNAAELEAMTQEPKINECIKEWEPTKHRRKFASLLDDLRGRHLVNYWGDKKTRRIYVSLIADDKAFCIAVADFIKSQKKKKRDVTQTILNLLGVQVK